MRIGIIGAGNIGHAMALLGVKHGHTVMLSNSRGPETLVGLAKEIGCEAGTPAQAAGFGEVVVIAIPLKNVASLPAGALSGKIVIDANNYYPDRDGHIAALDDQTTTTSEILAGRLPGAKIVKAINAIMARDLPNPSLSGGGRRALPIAGDDAEAKRVVAGLLEEFGFDVVDGGPLALGWRFERARPAYCVPFDSATLTTKLAATQRSDFVAEGSWRR